MLCFKLDVVRALILKARLCLFFPMESSRLPFQSVRRQQWVGKWGALGQAWQLNLVVANQSVRERDRKFFHY